MKTTLKRLIEVSLFATLLRTGIFTAGHFFIDIVVISSVTGSSLATSTIAALIGPITNGVWFFCIDRVWSALHAKDEAQHVGAG